MAYRALKRLKVGHDEEADLPIYREIGDEVPEVLSWPWQTVETYRLNGYIEPILTTDSGTAAESGKNPKKAATDGK